MISVTSTPLSSSFSRYSSNFSGGDVERDVVHRADRGHAVADGRSGRRRRDRLARHALGRVREPEERDAVDAVAHVEEEVLAAAAGQLERLHELHAEHVLVPGDGLGHVAADEREVVEAAQLELGVGVLGSRPCAPLDDDRHALHTVDRGRSRSIAPGRARSGTVAYSPAMPRLRQIPTRRGHRPDRPVDVRALVRRPRPGRRARAPRPARPGDWWTVFANSPDVLEHAAPRLRRSTPAPTARSPAQLRELGQTRAGWLVGSQFVFSQHCKACRALGFSEEKIEALKAWSVSDLFTPLERALLAYTDALVLGVRPRRRRGVRRAARAPRATRRSSSSPTSR